MKEIVNIVDSILASGSFWIPLIFGLMFLQLPFTSLPVSKYKRIKYILGAIYLLFAFISLSALLFNTGGDYSITIRLFVPVVAVYHMVLFTCINTSLISNTVNVKRRLIIGVTATTFFVVFYLTAYYADSNSTLFSFSNVLIYVFLAVQTIILNLIFFRQYKLYNISLDNYYSEISADHMSWVNFSQLLVVLMAVIVLFTPWLPDSLMSAFLGGILVFYVYYAIRIITYGINFINQNISLFDIQPVTNETEDKTSLDAEGDLELLIEKWVEDKNFIKHDITIVSVAAEMGTNRTYLSSHINTFKGQTFKEWIAELRIEEAKKQLLDDTEIAIGEVSMNVGFTDKSNFTRSFNKYTGSPPSVWRKANLKKL